MPGMRSLNQKLYQCAVCKLHYKEKELADECYAWCSKNPSCNLAVAQQSEEAINKGKKDE